MRKSESGFLLSYGESCIHRCTFEHIYTYVCVCIRVWQLATALLLFFGMWSATDHVSTLPHSFYDGESHRHIFGIPKPIRVHMETDKRVITKADPVFMR